MSYQTPISDQEISITLAQFTLSPDIPIAEREHYNRFYLLFSKIMALGNISREDMFVNDIHISEILQLIDMGLYIEARKEQSILLSRMQQSRCVDKETEALTNNGWKKYYEIKDNDKLVTWNSNDNKFDLEKPQSINIYDYDGNLVYVDTNNLSMAVTPNHRVYFYNSNGELMIRQADSISPKKINIPSINAISITKDKLFVDHYKGKVWCPTTKNQTWICQRNDKIHITGNSIGGFQTLFGQGGIQRTEHVERVIARKKSKSFGGKITGMFRKEDPQSVQTDIEE